MAFKKRSDYEQERMGRINSSKKDELSESIQVKEPELVVLPPDTVLDHKCARCGTEYKSEKAVIRDQERCCPNCLAPQSWSN